MPRIARISLEKGILLILARGNNHQWVFYSSQDFKYENRTVPFSLFFSHRGGRALRQSCIPSTSVYDDSEREYKIY